MTKEQFLTKLFTDLNEADIDYFVYGEYTNLPKHNGNSDIDLLVEESSFSSFIYILKKILIRSEIKLVSFYKNRNISFIRLLSEELWGIQFDVTRGWYHQGQIYYPTIYLKQNVFLHNGIVKVLDYHVGYYLDFFKEVINIGKSKDKYVKGFLEEYTNNRCNREKELESLYGRSFTKTINENLSEIKLKKIIPDLRHQMIDWIHRNDCLQRIKIRIESFARIFHCPGYVIAVEGTDGSGKSYIINTITPILNEAFHKGIEYRHLRPHVLPDLGILTGKKREGTNVAVVSNPHAQKPSGLLNSLVRWGYYMIDYTFGYMRLVWPQIHTKSKVFIFDRYYYDYYIDPIRAHISLPNQIFRFGEFFVPKPDLILCLGGTPETIYARKPETSLDEVRRQTIALQNFCKKRSKAVWVDTTLDPSDSVSTAMKSILSVMSKRFDINELK